MFWPLSTDVLPSSESEDTCDMWRDPYIANLVRALKLLSDEDRNQAQLTFEF